MCVWIAPVLVRETFTELFLSMVSCWESSYCALKGTSFKYGLLLQSASVLDGTIFEQSLVLESDCALEGSIFKYGRLLQSGNVLNGYAAGSTPGSAIEMQRCAAGSTGET